MSHSSIATLVKMANQIGQFYSAQKNSDQIADAANHFKRFWAPRMRANIADYVARGGKSLNPTALEAVKRISPQIAAAE
jgi:formate dehydrogenase subunit delta